MQVLLNAVISECGLFAPLWKSGHKYFAGHSHATYLAQAEAAYAGRRGIPTPLPKLQLPPPRDHSLEGLPETTVFRILRHGKLVHVSSNETSALREIAWRDWELGADGVEIEKQSKPAGTRWGRGLPHRFGGPWPKAKEEEFKRLYLEGKTLLEMATYFDTAAVQLGNKRKELGLEPRR